jgi:UDP-glucose 4-epimerase
MPIRLRPHLERVLITGTTGTLGYNVVRQFALAHPESKILAVMRTPNESIFSDLSNVSIEKLDMLDTGRVTETVRNFEPNAVIHAAASGVRPQAIDYFDLVALNVSATLDLFRATCELRNCHFINISTGLVYGQQERPCRESDAVNTLHPYGATKAAADCLLRSAAERLNRQVTIVRPFSFTGLHDGGDRLFPALLQAATDGKTMKMSPGTQLRDFCAVQDVAEAVCLIVEQGDHPGRDIFNVGSGLSISLGRIVHSVATQLSLDVEIEFGARPFHSLEPMQLVADISRAQALGWRPKTNLAYAVWQLAKKDFPKLMVSQPIQYRD